VVKKSADFRSPKKGESNGKRGEGGKDQDSVISLQEEKIGEAYRFRVSREKRINQEGGKRDSVRGSPFQKGKKGCARKLKRGKAHQCILG